MVRLSALFCKCHIMSVVLKTDCLDDFIGLSRADCDCFDVPTNVSLSGLYLDELEGLNLHTLDAAADECDEGDIWTMLKKAKEQAIIALKSDLAAQIASNYTVKPGLFQGNIGRDNAKTSTSINTYAAIKLLCNPLRGAVLRLKRIGAIFTGTGTFNVTVYNNLSTDPITTIAVNAVNGQLKWTSLNDILELPLYSADVNYLEYYFVYESPGFLPRSNGFRCCSFMPNYNITNPSWRRTNDQRYEWYQYVQATGVTGDTLDTIMADSYSFSDRAYGLMLDVEFKCNVRDMACYDTDFTNSNIPMVIAAAMRYKAGTILIQNILSAAKPNLYTMTGGERLMQENARYKKEYSARLDWLTQNMDLAKTGCVQCNPNLSKRSIL